MVAEMCLTKGLAGLGQAWLQVRLHPEDGACNKRSPPPHDHNQPVAFLPPSGWRGTPRPARETGAGSELAGHLDCGPSLGFVDLCL